MSVKDTGMAAMFLMVLGLSLVVNILFMVVVRRRCRLHNSHYILLTSIAVVDLVIGGSWTALSAVASLIGWSFPGEVCRLQSYLLTLTQTLTAFTLAAVAIERLIATLKPSRHALIFLPKITCILVAGLWVFCGVVASIHLYGTLPVTWQSDQHQCGAQFTESTKMLDFTFCIDHAIPYWVFALPAFVVAFIKIFLARRKSPRTGEIVLERNSYAPGDSYSNRLAKLQAKFGEKGNKAKTTKKATLGKRKYTRWGYMEPEHWDSDIEDGEEQPKGRRSTSKEFTQQRTYNLARPDHSMLVTAAATSLVTALLWFPWVVVRFRWNYKPFETVPDWLAVAAILCMHAAAFVKPVVYFLVNVYFRAAVLKTVCCRRGSRDYLLHHDEKTSEEGEAG